MHNINTLLADWGNAFACSFTFYANEKMEKKSAGTVGISETVLRAPVLGQAVNLTNGCKYVMVSACVPSYSASLCVHAHCLG